MGKPLKKLRLRRKRKVIETSAPPSASGTAPLSKYDRVDEAMHKAGEPVKAPPVKGDEGGETEALATNSTRFDNALFNSEARQTQSASQELFDAVSSRRDVHIAVPGSDDYRFLEMTGADASAGGPGNLPIIVKEKPQRLTLIEEFLHGAQSKVWGDPPLEFDNSVRNFREWHVRDFMNRHQQMFKWDADEQSVLKTELEYYRNLVEKQK